MIEKETKKEIPISEIKNDNNGIVITDSLFGPV